MKTQSIILFAALFVAANLFGCGDKSFSSASASTPSGFNSEQKSKYDKLTPEGKAYVSEQMDAYDKAKT